MSDELTSAIAHSLAMSYGSHISAPRGGNDWRAAENLLPIIDVQLRRAKAEALRDYASALEEVPDYAPSDYDQGRVDQRHMIITELLERADQAEEETDAADS